MRSPWIKLLGIICTLLFTTTFGTGAFSDNPQRVLLTDVKTLTLRLGQYTSGRRSEPVPQLRCVGGSAQGMYTPPVVQCYNRGSDGNDIQWECKTDLDNSFRFGSVEVTCEGYAYPDDPYILTGSCGLEYTLELTEEGMQRRGQQKKKYEGYQSDSDGSPTWGWNKKSKSGMGDLLFIGGVVLVIYIIYKSCLAPNARREGRQDDSQRPHTDRGRGQPPPYGFHPDYMPGNDGCSGGATYGSGGSGASTYANNTGNQGGGFWSGAATGGLLGYLFGRNSGYGGYTQHQPYGAWGSTYQQPGWFSGWGSGWGSGSGSRGYSSRSRYGGSPSFGGFSSGGGGGATSSSGTRTASGFGGTKRR